MSETTGPLEAKFERWARERLTDEQWQARQARKHTRIFATTAEGWAEIGRRDTELELNPRDRVTGLPMPHSELYPYMP